MLALNKISMAVGLTLLVGCAQNLQERISSDQTGVQNRAQTAQTLARKPQVAAPYLSEESLPRFTTRSVPFARDDKLPATLGKVTMRMPGRHTLGSVAEMVQRLIDIPVVVTPDALLDPALFAPGQAVVGAAVAPIAPGATSNAGLTKAMLDNNDIKQRAADAGSRQAPLSDKELSSTFELNYSGTVTGLLDNIATRAGVQWQYQQGRITFSRVVTRSLAVKALAGGLTAGGSVTLGGGMSGSTSVQSDVWPMLELTLRNLVSPRGRIQVDPKSGTVTVTDALQNVNAVAKFIDKQNDIMLRQIVLDVEVLQVDLKQEHAAGIDWSVVGKGVTGFNISGPASMGAYGGGAGGLIGASFARQDGGSTKALINALEQYGRVTSSYSTVVTTTNRQPVPLGVQSSQSYLASISAAPINPLTNTATGGATLTPGTVSTGFSMMLMPVIMDSNRILIESTLQISSLREMKSFSSSAPAPSSSASATQTASTVSTIQLPSIDSYSTLQRINVASGDTMIMSGFEREISLRDDSDMVRGAVPGSRRGQSSKQSTVILITPRLQ